MKRFWSHQDGRLRTGPVSLALFSLLLLTVCFVMKMAKPVDQVMVKIDHLFAAGPQAEGKIAEEPVSQDDTQDVNQQETVNADKALPGEETARDVSPDQPIQKATNPVESDTEHEEETKTIVEHTELTEPSPVNREAVAKEKLAPNEIEHRPEVEPVTAAEDSLSQTEEDHEKQKIVTETMSRDEPVVVATTLPNQSVQQTAPLSQPDAFRDLQKVANPIATDAKTGAVTVTQQQYRELFQAWRAAPSSEADEATQPGLVVENLRQSFGLFQMKPVAMVGDVAYDLVDGSRMAEGSLDRYAGTVFRVAQPWQDWGRELKKLGLRSNDKFEVRYYMHSYVSNGIYSRCRQVLNWCQQQGLVAVELTAGEVEIRGRTYAVQQQGGGRFGVFIPQQLRLADGRIVAIELEALGSAPDVAVLRQAGLI